MMGVFPEQKEEDQKPGWWAVCSDGLMQCCAHGPRDGRTLQSILNSVLDACRVSILRDRGRGVECSSLLYALRL